MSTAELRAEYERLTRILTCVVCQDKLIVIAFVPCGHLITCQDCGSVLESCPFCRVAIQQRLVVDYGDGPPDAV